MIYEVEANSPEENLKRADHLVFVSLKITRTTDILKNAIKRLIDTYEIMFDEYVEDMYRKGKLEEVPDSIKEKVKIVKDSLGNAFGKYYRVYLLLKKIDKAEYEAFEEFRKNVTLRTKTVPPMDIKMDNVTEYLAVTKEAVKFLRECMAKNE